MKRSLFHRSDFQEKVANLFAQTELLQSRLDAPELPDNTRDWLSRLRLLQGVPFNYLVPDERMLPPESIRFFYVDMNWVDALIDGAFSIGRNLTTEENEPTRNQDAAVMPTMQPQVALQATTLRAKNLGVEPPQATLQADLQVVSGFLLRSTIVSAYRGIGVEAYSDSTAKNPLEILRMEPLGDHSNTLLCLVKGDAIRIDIHEAPEHLHYGIDTYDFDPETNKVTANKIIRTFARDGSKITLTDCTENIDLSNSFRPDSPRVLKMTALADLISKANKVTDIDSAEMGFEMTQGVGQVSFNKEDNS